VDPRRRGSRLAEARRPRRRSLPPGHRHVRGQRHGRAIVVALNAAWSGDRSRPQRGMSGRPLTQAASVLSRSWSNGTVLSSTDARTHTLRPSICCKTCSKTRTSLSPRRSYWSRTKQTSSPESSGRVLRLPSSFRSSRCTMGTCWFLSGNESSPSWPPCGPPCSAPPWRSNGNSAAGATFAVGRRGRRL
jgi:hypothetical protein